MLAAYYEKFGPAHEALCIAEVQSPQPGPGEVSVRVHASGVNPYDVKLRGGVSAAQMPFPRIIPHCDGAGIIDAVGSGVDHQRIGERVWIWNGQVQRAFGTAAQIIALPAEQAAPLPPGLSFEEGACLGVPYLTAYQALLYNGPIDGKTVVVTGGGGSVGFYAIQIAKAKGAACIIATVSTSEREAHARRAGADHVLDYKKADIGAAVRDITAGAGADRLIEVEFGLNVPFFTHVLRPGGAVFSYGSAGNMMPKLDFKSINSHGLTMHFSSVYRMGPQLRAQAVADLFDFPPEGFVHPVGRVFDLPSIAAAHENVEAGRTIGNTVIRIA